MSDCETCPSKGGAACAMSQRQPQETDDAYADRMALQQRMCKIRNKILVMSGKGGVGKSTTAAQLALGLAKGGQRVGLLDVDVHGPSVPHLLGLAGMTPEQSDGEILPVQCDGLSVMSIGFFLENAHTPLIWRGPMKTGLIKQFLKDVAWGELDTLVIDCPPGTGDEPLSVAQMIPKATGAVVVTTPQEVALIDVRKAVEFCRQIKLPVLGVVENMSGVVCPKCGEVIDLFGAGGGAKMAEEMAAPFLGSVPFEPELVRKADRGGMADLLDGDGETQKAFAAIVKRLSVMCH